MHSGSYCRFLLPLIFAAQADVLAPIGAKPSAFTVLLTNFKQITSHFLV